MTDAPQTVQANPLSQSITALINTKLVSMEEVSFSFRTTKVKDPSGATVDDGQGNQIPKEIDWKRPTFKVNLPLVTNAGLIAGIQAGDKTTDLIRDAVNNAVIDRMRGLINEKLDVDPSIELKSDTFDLGQLSLVAIANLPKSERGAGIPKEAWQAFVADYKQVMSTPDAIALFPDKKPRSPDVLDKHGILLAGKFNQIRSRKDTVGQMLGFLDIWVQKTQNAEEHLACYEHLVAKGKALMTGESFEDL